MGRERLLDNWLRRICLATVLLQAVFYAVRVLVSYRILAVGGDAAAIGVVTALFSLAPVLIAIQVGRAVDRAHARGVFVAGIAAAVLGCLVLAAGTSLWMIGIGSMLVGSGQLLATVASQSFVSILSPPGEHDQDKGFAALLLSVSIGQALGLPVAGLLASGEADTGVETTPALLIMSLVGLVALPFIARLRQSPRPARPTDSAGESQGRQRVIDMLRLPGLSPAIFSSLVVLAAMDLTVAYLPLLGHELGFSVELVSLLLTVRTLASILSRALLPLLLRAVPRRVLLVSAALVPAIPTAAIPFVGNPVAIGVLLAVAGIFWGLGQPLTMTWVVGLVTPDNRGAALSLRLTGNRMGQVAVPGLAGLAAGIGGTAAVFVITGALLATAAASTTRATRL